MSIEVKGVNDVLVLKLSQDINIEGQLKELDTLLDQPLFNQEGFFPRAFFDLGCQKMEEEDLLKLIQLLKTKKKVLFDGITLPVEKHAIKMVHDQLRNGQEFFIYEETLFLGVVNPGSFVYCYENVYFLNKVKGTIVIMKEDVKIYGHSFEKAHIMINQLSLHNLTTLALVSVYYKDREIKVEKEDTYEDNSRYIW